MTITRTHTWPTQVITEQNISAWGRKMLVLYIYKKKKLTSESRWNNAGIASILTGNQQQRVPARTLWLRSVPSWNCWVMIFLHIPHSRRMDCPGKQIRSMGLPLDTLWHFCVLGSGPASLAGQLQTGWQSHHMWGLTTVCHWHTLVRPVSGRRDHSSIHSTPTWVAPEGPSSVSCYLCSRPS